MEFFNSQEKMVAGTAYYCADYSGVADYIGRNFGNRSVYLYFILMKEPQRHKELETILVLVLASGVFYWYYKKPVFLLVALIIGLTGLLVPLAGKIIHKGWMKLAEGIGFVMNKVILTIIFFLIVIPFGWITRKIGKSSVKLKPGGSSYFIDRNHDFTREDMENPW